MTDTKDSFNIKLDCTVLIDAAGIEKWLTVRYKHWYYYIDLLKERTPTDDAV